MIFFANRVHTNRNQSMMSQFDLSPGFELTNWSDIGTDERRTAKRLKNAALPGRLTGNCPSDCGPQPRGIRPVLRQAARERSDEVAVTVEPKNLEPGHSPLLEAIPIVPDRALLRLAAHDALHGYIQ